MTTPRYPHQDEAVQRLVSEPALLLALAPGLGKSRIVTDAACDLYRAGLIDAVVVVCPAPLRSIWADPDPVLGEWSKWASVPATVVEYSVKNDRLPTRNVFTVVVTNPEFLRREPRLDPLVAWCKARRVLLVADESWQYQSRSAAQTKALYTLRRACQRVVLLNGTPGEIKDQFTQFMILDKAILGMNYWQARARFCRMGGYFNKQIVGYQREDEFAALTAPYVMTRTLRDCVPMPEPVRTQIEVPLTPTAWRIYKQLRDEFLADLEGGAVATALQAGVRALRLAQVVNGFVGGVDEEGAEGPAPIREVGHEKLDGLVAELTDAPPDKVLIFTRFRADVERTVEVLATQYDRHRVLPLYGGQAAEEREEAKRLLAPDGDPRPAMIVANAASGGAGLNLTAAAVCYFLANDYSLKTRVQAEGRIDRIGQVDRTRFVDVLATGPKGERTIDHGIVAALRRKEDLATASIDAWKALLTAA